MGELRQRMEGDLVLRGMAEVTRAEYLPDGYTKIRHYGLLAAGNVNTKLARARELIEQHQPPSPPSPPPSPRPSDTAATVATELHSDGTAADPAKPTLRCPTCQGTTFLADRHAALRAPPPHAPTTRHVTT